MSSELLGAPDGALADRTGADAEDVASPVGTPSADAASSGPKEKKPTAKELRMAARAAEVRRGAARRHASRARR